MPPRKLPKPKLPGSLGRPIEIDPIPSSLTLESRIEWIEEKKIPDFITAQRFKKLEELAAYYKLTTNNSKELFRLSYRIACDFLDGFHVIEKPKRGRTKVWDEEKLYMLWCEVEEIMKSKTIGALPACRLLVGKQPWSFLLKTQVKTADNKEKCEIRAKELYKWYSKSKKSANGRRGIDNIEYVTAVPLDYDDGTPFDTILRLGANIEFIAYSTYRHSIEKLKFRLVIPLSRPVSASEYPAVWAALNAMLGGMADDGAKDAARLNYWPSCPPDKADIAFEYHNRGAFVEPDALMLAALAKTPLNAALLSGVPSVPDFTRGVETGKRDNTCTSYAGWLCELYLPRIGKVNWTKAAKNPAEILLITEGEKKAAAACKAGYHCIGLGGVWNFKSRHGVLQDWDQFAFTGRTVLIVYDSDIIDKPQVRYAEYALAVELVARGANVMRVRLPHSGDGKVGLDDFLVANGLMKTAAAARTAFEVLPLEKIDPAFPPHLTELGNAIRLEEEFGYRLRYVPKWKAWISCNLETRLWQVDDDGAAMRCAKELPYILRAEAKKLAEEAQKKIINWARISESEKCLNATLNLAKSQAGLILSDELTEADGWKLAFRNGTAIDLRTGILQQIAPDDFLIKSTSVLYDPRALCPLWEKFLLEVMNGDKEMVRFLQRAVGYSLTGDMSEQCLFIAYGAGANGKSTLLNILLALFGEYARQAAPQTFMAQGKDASTPRSDLCRLVGIRLVATSETENYQRLSEALIKQWTGGEQIVTRDLYGKTFEFSPKGKIWLTTNHRPHIRGTDDAIWRRVMLIPFTRTFAERDRDPELFEKLKAELPGILNWALQGCKDWQAQGLNPPESVRQAVKKYRAYMDVIGEWVKECCVVGDEYRQLVATLFDDYKQWAKNTEEYVFRQRDFSQYLEERGYKKKQTTDRSAGNKGWFLLGLDLKARGSGKFKLTPQPRNKR